jgi:SAM-dependent methyltransferase
MVSSALFSQPARRIRWFGATGIGRAYDVLTMARSPVGSRTASSLRQSEPGPGVAPVELFDRNGADPLPVFGAYRYSLKPTWRLWAPLHAVSLLVGRGLVDGSVRDQMSTFAGQRTLTASLSEIGQWAEPIVRENAKEFLGDPLAGWPVLVDSRMRLSVQATTRALRLLGSATRAGLRLDRPGRVLDVGAGSGLCAAGLALMGAEVTAIDNGYGSGGELSTAAAIARTLGVPVEVGASSVERYADDNGEAFDLVVSTSVLEHVGALDRVVGALWSLLRPGGFALHLIDPFTGPRGGHSILMPDQPYGHLRLPPEMLYEYVERLRPYEASEARRWLQGLLYPMRGAEAYASAFTHAGFELLSLERRPAPRALTSALTASVRADIRRWRPDVADADLLSDALTIVAQKPRR